MVVRGYDVVALLKKTGKEIGDDKIAVYAAQISYTMFFGLFPLLLVFAALLGLIADPRTVMGWIGGAARSLPPAVATLLTQTAEKVIFAKGNPGVLSFGLLTALWSGSSIFGALREAMNAAYDVKETRPWWKQQLLQLSMVAVSAVVLLVSTVILVNGEGVVSWLGDHLHAGGATRLAWTVLQFPIAIAFVIGVLWAQYQFLPNCSHKGKAYTIVGAVVAGALWIAATLLFRLYVQKFHVMNEAYGTIGAIMVLLTWMYYSAFVLLAAAELNSELEAGTGRRGAHGEATGKDAESPVPREHALVPVGEGEVAARWAAHVRAGDRVSPIGGDGRAAFRGTAPDGGERRSLLQLLAHLAAEGAALVRHELQLASTELGEAARAVGTGVATLAVGGVLALLGVLAVVSGLVLLVGDQWLPRDAYWAAALLVVVLTAATAWWMVNRARALLSADALVPQETIETLEEDAEWLKRPTTSVARSS